MSAECSIVPLSDLVATNPATPTNSMGSSDLVSFIPMVDVTESGEWIGNSVRRLRDVRSGFTAFRDDDILFAKITPCMENGKGAHVTGLQNGIGFGSTEFHVLRAIPGVYSRYVYHWLQSSRLRQKAEAMMTGSAGQQRVPAEFFSRVSVPLFAYDEQRRIADILDAVDAAVQQTEALIAKLKMMKAGLLRDLLTRGMDAEGWLRDAEARPEEFKESVFGRVPKDWSIVTLDTLIESAVDGPFGSNLKTAHYVTDPGVRIVRLQNIGIGYFDDSDKAYVAEEHAANLQRYSVVAGDLVVASLGDENHPNARACLYPDHMQPGIVKADCFRIRLDPARALHAYVMHVLNSPTTRGDISIMAQGVTRDRINLTTLRRFRLRLPPLEEQRRVTDVLGAQDGCVRREEQYRDKLRQIKQGLMDDLLTGRVRVDLAGKEA